MVPLRVLVAVALTAAALMAAALTVPTPTNAHTSAEEAIYVPVATTCKNVTVPKPGGLAFRVGGGGDATTPLTPAEVVAACGDWKSWVWTSSIERDAALEPTSVSWRASVFRSTSGRISGKFKVHSMAMLARYYALAPAMCDADGNVFWYTPRTSSEWHLSLSDTFSIDVVVPPDDPLAPSTPSGSVTALGDMAGQSVVPLPAAPNRLGNVVSVAFVACAVTTDASTRVPRASSPSHGTGANRNTTDRGNVPSDNDNDLDDGSSDFSTMLNPADLPHVFVTMQTTMRFSWGSLTPQAWFEFIFCLVMLVPKTILVVWFGRLCLSYRENVLKQQKFFLYAAVASLFATLLWVIDFAEANRSGRTACCDRPVPMSAIVLQGVQWITTQTFFILLLATAKGWGVVRPRLDAKEVRNIMLFFFFTVCVFTARRLVRPSLGLETLVIAANAAMWIWVFLSLQSTMRELGQSERPESAIKLSMYRRLRTLTRASLWLIVFILFGIIGVFFMGGEMLVYSIPYSLPWELPVFVLMAGFAWLWQPSSATALFAYSFEVADHAAEETDPIASFGVELERS